VALKLRSCFNFKQMNWMGKSTHSHLQLPFCMCLFVHFLTPLVCAHAHLTHLQGMFSGWRNELYPVTAAFDAQPALLLERAAAPYFGIRAYGVHVNGYVVGADGSKKLWVARRSATKQTWPGKLDHIVAGGQVSGQVLGVAHRPPHIFITYASDVHGAM
jgi:hypothetical protein